MSQRPYRYDIVGSFLRPAYLKEARTQYANGVIRKSELTAVEDKAIKELVEKEKAVGLKAVTDGEFRRKMWHLDFLEELDGVQHVDQSNWSVEFKGDKPKGATLTFTDQVDFPVNHPFLAHFAYLKSIAGDVDLKQTILHRACCI